MMLRRFYYLLLLSASGFFVMLYDFQGLRFLICCILFVPLTGFLLLIPRKFLCRADLSVRKDTMSRGDSAECMVTVKNRGFLPVSRVMIKLCWKAPGEKAVRVRQYLRCPGAGEKIPLTLEASHCGKACLTMEKAVIYDYFGLFSLTVGRKRKVEICVTPVITPVSSGTPDFELLRRREMTGEEEGDLLLRDFQPGDSLRRIYWKMTAKGGELQVRDFERDGSLRVFLNFTAQLAQQPEKWDMFLDRVCSLMAFWTERNAETNENILEIVWPQGEGFLKCAIANMEAVEAWVCALLKGEAVGTPLLEEEILCLREGYHLEEDAGLYFGEQCVYEEAGTFI